LVISKTQAQKGFAMTSKRNKIPSGIKTAVNPGAKIFVPGEVWGRVLLDACLVNCLHGDEFQYCHIYITERDGYIYPFKTLHTGMNEQCSIDKPPQHVMQSMPIIRVHAKTGEKVAGIFSTMLDQLLPDFYLQYCVKQSLPPDDWRKPMLEELCNLAYKHPQTADGWYMDVNFPVRGVENFAQAPAPKPAPVARLSKEDWLKANYPGMKELPKWRFPGMVAG
jgi:hypothetical protein